MSIPIIFSSRVELRLPAVDFCPPNVFVTPGRGRKLNLRSFWGQNMWGDHFGKSPSGTFLLNLIVGLLTEA